MDGELERRQERQTHGRKTQDGGRQTQEGKKNGEARAEKARAEKAIQVGAEVTGVQVGQAKAMQDGQANLVTASQVGQAKVMQDGQVARRSRARAAEVARVGREAKGGRAMEAQEYINEIVAEALSRRRGPRPLRRRRLLPENAQFTGVVQHVAMDQTEAQYGDRLRDRPRVVRSSVAEKTREVHFSGGGPVSPLLRGSSGYLSYHSRAERAVAVAERRFRSCNGSQNRPPLRSFRAEQRRAEQRRSHRRHQRRRRIQGRGLGKSEVK